MVITKRSRYCPVGKWTRAFRADNKQYCHEVPSGFTLIELLVVVAIIGILAAIAIPQFAAYRAKGFDARAESDCRNVATAEEAFFLDNATYSSDADSLPGFVQSADVTLELSGDDQGFTATCSSAKGTQGFQCTWDSAPERGNPNMQCATS